MPGEEQRERVVVTFSGPSPPGLCGSIAASISRAASAIGAAAFIRSRPAGVSAAWFGPRSSSATPSARSSRRMRRPMVGWLSPSASPAWFIDP